MKDIRRCSECIHECACAMWNIGSIDNMDARNCSMYETVKDSAAYFLGRLDEIKRRRKED